MKHDVLASKKKRNSDGSCFILTSRKVHDENKGIAEPPNHPFNEKETDPSYIGLSVYRCEITQEQLEGFCENRYGVDDDSSMLVQTVSGDWNIKVKEEQPQEEE